MQELKELISLFTSRTPNISYKIKYIAGKKNSRVNKLIYDISSEKINSEEEAMKELYGTKSEKAAYRKLKERLRQRLFTGVLFAEPRVRNEKTYDYNVFFCHKNYVIAAMLIKMGATRTGKKLMERVLAKADKYQVQSVALLSAQLLRRLCVARGDIKSFDKYGLRINKYYAVIGAESNADEMHDRLMIRFAHSHSAKPELIAEAKHALEHIEMLKNVYDTFNLNLTYFLVRNLYAQLNNDYEESFKACTEFEEYFISQPAFYSKARHANISIIKVDCYLCLGRYAEGLDLAGKSLMLYDGMFGNKLILLELQLILAIQAREYTLASTTYYQLISNADNKSVYTHQKEMWYILGGYLWLLLTNEKLYSLRLETFNQQSPDFLLENYNSFIIFNQDKQGVNISLIFLQFILSIQNRDYNKVIDRAEQLRTYMYKNIDRKQGIREYTFLKLLQILIRYNFDPHISEIKGEYLRKKLELLPGFIFAYANRRVEIINYSRLWNMILKDLKTLTPARY